MTQKFGHARMLKSGILAGNLDEETRRAWPPWARRHARACAQCQRVVAIEDATLVLREPSRPLPSAAVLHERLLARKVPDPGLFLPRGAGASARRYRSDSGAALELFRTPSGVRALDPDALDLILFTVSSGRFPQVLGRRDAERPGVGLEVDIDLATPVSIVALSSRTKLDVALWRAWLSDVFRAETPTSLPLGSATGRVHGVVLHVRQATGRELIRVATHQVEEPDPTVTSLLKEATAAVRAGDMAATAHHYRRAQERAQSLCDTSGEVRAALGLSQALFHLGHDDDAEQILGELIATHELDAKRADMVCRTMAWRCVHRSQAVEAARWVAESERVGLQDEGWRHPIYVAIAFLERNYSEALRLIATAPGDHKIPNYETFLRLQGAVALLALGRMAEAKREVSEADPFDTSIEHLLWRQFARGLAGPPSESVASAEVRRVGDYLDRNPESRRAKFVVPPLHGLIRAYDEAGLTRQASDLLRLRFLPAESALQLNVRALVAGADGSTVLVTDPADPGALHRIQVTRSELLRLSARAREEVLTGDKSPSALPALRALLFPKGRLHGVETLVVACDGSLEDAPIPALLSIGVPLEAALVPVRRVTASSKVTARGHARTIASLADAWSDLPAGAREIHPGEAEVYLRGRDVTRGALAGLPEVGLLHIAVHARREGGLPFLLFADGATSPVDIGVMSFRGSPVVLLSGCATSSRVGGHGIERSLADGFFRAGARAVIATRWPVEDREMHDLVRSLVTRWPFDSAARAVAQVASEARSRGAPARVWASLVVYEPFEPVSGQG